MRVNTRKKQPTTHEGGPSMNLKPIDALKRSCLACLLWEEGFYESGVQIQERIKTLADQVSVDELKSIIEDCYKKQYLRHMPLLLLRYLLKKPGNSCKTLIRDACQRPDQMTELLALYWKEGRDKLDHQLVDGLAMAFRKFDEYQLAKWNKDSPVKLKDVLFLSHAKPKNKEQEQLWKRLIKNELKVPDTWETRLSAGENKKESFEELLKSRKIGTMAILRNVRNMQESGIRKDLVRDALLQGRSLLPFEYFRAARACPQWKDMISEVLLSHLKPEVMLKGNTMVFVDVSSSMDVKMSSKSETTYMDAACCFAILLRECCETGIIVSFSNNAQFIPSRRGFDLANAIVISQEHGGTALGQSMEWALQNSIMKNIDRIIVITDEQTRDRIPKVESKKNYIINVASNEHGVEVDNTWTTITGFSANSIDYIIELEKLDASSECYKW